jgi:hypothetical protein
LVSACKFLPSPIFSPGFLLSPSPPCPAAQPINLTLHTDPSRPIQYAAALGSGDIVLANGTTTSGPSFEAIGGLAGGRVVAMWVDVPSVTVTSAG